MKDFWKLNDFKSTKYNYITFHIIMTLISYLYFQIYKNLEKRQAYAGKSLPVVAKNYTETKPKKSMHWHKTSSDIAFVKQINRPPATQGIINCISQLAKTILN